MKKLTALLAFLAWIPQQAAAQGVPPAINANASLTRPANTTQYTANTAVCQSTSANCTPLAIALGNPQRSGTIGRVMLEKSGNGTTSATFNIFFFASSPTVSSVHDDSAYTGPFAADIPGYLGSAACSTTNNTSDGTAQVWYECSTSNLTTNGLPYVVSSSSVVYAMIEVTGAYTPASGETFTVYVSFYPS